MAGRDVDTKLGGGVAQLARNLDGQLQERAMNRTDFKSMPSPEIMPLSPR